jgi:hypothetical protein
LEADWHEANSYLYRQWQRKNNGGSWDGIARSGTQTTVADYNSRKIYGEFDACKFPSEVDIVQIGRLPAEAR